MRQAFFALGIVAFSINALYADRVSIQALPQTHLRYADIRISNPPTNPGPLILSTFDLSALPLGVNISRNPAYATTCESDKSLSPGASCDIWLHADTNDTLGKVSGSLTITALNNGETTKFNFNISNETDLYVLGWFNATADNSVILNSIGYWNGLAWHSIIDGSGSNGLSSKTGVPWAMAAALADDDLYVSGQFDHAGDTAVNNIAKWNGTTWSDVGGGLDDNSGNGSNVFRLFADKAGHLYAGGYFNEAGSNKSTAVGLAEYAGGTWSNMGADIQGTSWPFSYATDFAETSEGIHVGGNFNAIGNAPTDGLALWSANAWSGASGVDYEGGNYGSAQLIATLDGTIYVIGTTPGTDQSALVAEKTAAGWQQLPTEGGILQKTIGTYSLSGPLLFDENHDILYVGGNFGAQGGILLAAWNGQNASVVSGLTVPASACQSSDCPAIYSLTLDHAGNDLYASGSFDAINGLSFGHIMLIHPQTPGAPLQTLGRGLNGTVVQMIFVPSINVSSE